MKKTLRTTFWIISVLLVIVLVCVVHAQEAKRAVRVNGAGMGSDQVQLWAAAFTAANPDMPVVVTGSSAGKGFLALFEKNADLALASRIISADEQQKAKDLGLKLDTRLIGYSGLAILTHPRNPVNELTMDQLRKIFTGEYTNWSNVGGPARDIRCLTRRIPESGGAMFFLEAVLHNQPYARTTVWTESWTAILKVCSVATDLPIGMGPAIIANKQGIKVLGVKQDDNSPAIKPTEQTLKDKSYPIIVPIHFYWDSQTKDDRIAKFVDFCASKGLSGSSK